jgi:hypothetical protein
MGDRHHSCPPWWAGVRVTTVWWRWRESNPRPSVMGQGFSGRSLLGGFSAPVLTQASHRRAQSLLGVPTGPATGPAGGVSLRCQVPGRRHSRADRVATRLRRRERTRTASCWQFLVTVAGLTRSQPQPSARFPWLDRPKSKPVTPMLSCQRCWAPRGVRPRPYMDNAEGAKVIPGRGRVMPRWAALWRAHRG